METAKVTANLQIEVPQEIKKWLTGAPELAAFLEGDTLILKKINFPKLTTIAERRHATEMPLEEISEEVHRYRKERKSKKDDGRK